MAWTLNQPTGCPDEAGSTHLVIQEKPAPVRVYLDDGRRAGKNGWTFEGPPTSCRD